MRDIVILGGGQAGAFAASALRAQGFDGSLRVVCEEPRPPYERPPLSKGFLLSQASAGDLAIFHSGFWTGNSIELVLGVTATRINAAAKRVETSAGDLSADAVIVSTGARPRRLSVPGAGLPGVHYLRSVDDAEGLRAALRPGKAVVVIGGGLIGSELASTAADIGCPVTVIDVQPVPLARALGALVSRRLMREQQSRGIVSVVGPVERIHGVHSVTAVEVAAGDLVPADVVIIGIGVIPRVEIAVSSGLDVGDGVLCDSRGKTSSDGIFAAGDVARVLLPGSVHSRRVEHWKNAISQGQAVASAILGGTAARAEPQWYWTEQHGQRVEVAGEVPAEGASVAIRGDAESGSFSVWYGGEDGDVAAVVGYNRPRDVRAALRLLARPDRKFDGRSIADESTPLREFAR